MKGDIVKCAYCGKEFIQSRTSNIYCSPKCCRSSRNKTDKRIVRQLKSKYNPYPITTATVYMTVRCLEKGESIESIEAETQRRPGQLKEMIDKLKSNGEYDKIVKQIRKGSESPACFNSYKISRPMHQQNIICYD